MMMQSRAAEREKAQASHHESRLHETERAAQAQAAGMHELLRRLHPSG